MATATFQHGSAEQRFLLRNVSWQTYQKLLAETGVSHVRLTYDRGKLEFMAPSFRHERFSGLLAQCVRILAEELNIAFTCGGSTTFQRQDLEKGLEPDECFYFSSLPLILGKTEIDLAIDPPPDLAIEVDITSSALDRFSIYAALGVPEIWRFDGQAVQVYCLGEQGQYAEHAVSPTFASLPLLEIAAWLHQGVTMDDLTFTRMFRAWVIKEVLPKWHAQGQGR